MRKRDTEMASRRTKSASGGFIIIAPLLLAVCVVGLTLIVSRSVPLFMQQEVSTGQPYAPLPVQQLTEKVLSASDWSGPYIVLVQRADGSFAYAYVEDATIENGAYVGGTWGSGTPTGNTGL